MLRLVRPSVLALALAAPPPLVQALDYGGALGVTSTRSDSWAAGQPTGTERQLRLIGNLSLAGAVVSPEMLRWGADFGYDGYRGALAGPDQDSDYMRYSLRLSALDSPSSRLTVNGSAGRNRTEFSVDAPSGSAGTGVSRSDAYDLGVSARAPGGVGASVRGLHRETTNSGLGRETTQETSDQVDAGIRHGTGAYSWAANYSGIWNDGTLPTSAYVYQSLGMNLTADLAPAVSSTLSLNHRERTPGTVDPLSPTTESNSILATVSAGGPFGNSSSGLYSYVHDLALAPGSDTREFTGHAITYSHTRDLAPEWSGTAAVGAQFSRARAGADELDSAGQSLGATGRWIHRSPDGMRLDLSVGPRVGLVEPAGGSTKLAYGASGRGQADTKWRAATFSLVYNVDYSSNLDAKVGWILRQALSADAETWLSAVRIRGQVLATGVRQSVEPFGSNAMRSILGNVTASGARHSLRLEAGASDGVQANVGNSILGDGLFFPASFDTHSRYAALTAVSLLGRRATASIMLRYATASGGGVPNQNEASAWGRISYALGQFSLGLEDRYVMGGATSFDVRTNSVFVTLARGFGGRL